MVELAEHPGGMLSRGFGGDTLNTSLYLARLAVPVDYVTALGDDPFSDEMLQSWAAEGIGTDLIPRVAGALPGLYLIRTNATGERRFYYWRDNAPAKVLFRLPEIDAVETALCRASLIYLSGITLSLLDDFSRDRLFQTLVRARQAGAQVVFDTNFRPRGWPDTNAARAVYARMFRGADLVLASVEDHSLLYGSAEPDAVVERLDAAGVPEIVIKLRAPACRIVSGRDDVVVQAEPVGDVIDTTAAGDSFAAGYIAARRAGCPPTAAAKIGHQLAGTVVRYRGAIIPKAAMPNIILTSEAA